MLLLVLDIAFIVHIPFVPTLVFAHLGMSCFCHFWSVVSVDCRLSSQKCVLGLGLVSVLSLVLVRFCNISSLCLYSLYLMVSTVKICAILVAQCGHCNPCYTGLQMSLKDGLALSSSYMLGASFPSVVAMPGM